jgi:hypothetical protein
MIKEIIIALILAVVFAVLGGVAEHQYNIIHQLLNK